jgi:Fungal specific transcription factor domain/Fungal Zn(2)-Cys(6) binuclear cluster domain
VKCDETLPHCVRCTSTGRKCDGYKVSTQETTPALQFLPPDTVMRPLPIGIIGSLKERRSFDFFQKRTAPQISGFFGGDIWERLLLQATYHEPSVRHAIIALGSLHERFEQDNGLVVHSDANGWSDDFALRNYNLAIKHLVEPLSSKGQQAIDVCLISCILFACFEVRHLKSAPASHSQWTGHAK